MQPFHTSPNEPLRLATLHGLGILDSAAEERFDRFTRLASVLFKLPICLISLTDADRVWFKSRVGLEYTELPRNISLCNYTAQRGELTVIEDTLVDERFADHPMVAGEARVRFYAGCPLIADNGSLLGTFCLAGVNPRVFSADERQALIDLSDLVEHELLSQSTREDAETGLLNRDGFLTLAEQALRICQYQGMPFTLVRLRLHEGDCIPRAEGAPVGKLARLLRETMGAGVIVGRVSTRDLAIGLCNTNLHQAGKLLDRVRFAGELDAPDMQSLRSHGVHAVAVPDSPDSANDVTSMLQSAFRHMRNSSTNIVESASAA